MFVSSSRRLAPISLLALIALFVGCSGESRSQERAGQGNAATTTPAVDQTDDPFAVPDGTPKELLAFIQKLASPQPFETEDQVKQYMARAAVSISKAANKILSAEGTTNKQAMDALEWKMEAYRLRWRLGDQDALDKADEFLAKIEAVASPDMARNIRRVWLTNKMTYFPYVDSATRAKAVQDVVEYLKTVELEPLHAVVILEFVNQLEDTPESPVVVQALENVLPLFQKTDNPEIANYVGMMEGSLRRLNLPGNEIKLQGTFLDGTPLDWDSYRGKTVLVDFWSTSCGYCIAEMPQIKELYEAYHDKGFEVIAISLDEEREPVEEFWDEAEIPWRTLFGTEEDADGYDHPMAVRYSITKIPRAILVDENGEVVTLLARGPNLRKELQRLLGDPDKPVSPATDADGQQDTTSQQSAKPTSQTVR